MPGNIWLKMNYILLKNSQQCRRIQCIYGLTEGVRVAFSSKKKRELAVVVHSLQNTQKLVISRCFSAD